MKTLTIDDFVKHEEQDLAAMMMRHYYEYKIPGEPYPGAWICMETCMDGYCVGIYTAHSRELEGEKICTNLGATISAAGYPGYSGLMDARDEFYGMALTKAVDIANDLLEARRQSIYGPPGSNGSVGQEGIGSSV